MRRSIFVAASLVLFIFSFHQALSNFNYLRQSYVLDKIPAAYGQISEKTESTIDHSSTLALNSDPTSIFFLGDIMMGRDVERTLNKKGYSYSFDKLDYKSGKNFVVANFEASIPQTHIPTPDNTFRFSIDKKFLPVLKEAGITHLGLANNHSFDYGLSAYNNTVSEIWNNDLVPFGHPTKLSTSSVTFLDVDSEVFSVIAVHALFAEPTENDIKNVLNFASLNSDMQIVFIHWGNEYSKIPSQKQRKLAKAFVEAGADLIIGHHPHVVQTIEKIDETLIFYSLGNYIFDQYFSPEVQTGLTLELVNSNPKKVNLIPVSSIDNRIQPRALDESEKEYFLENLAKLSPAELRENILLGEFLLPEKLATSTEVVIMAE